MLENWDRPGSGRSSVQRADSSSLSRPCAGPALPSAPTRDADEKFPHRKMVAPSCTKGSWQKQPEGLTPTPQRQPLGTSGCFPLPCSGWLTGQRKYKFLLQRKFRNGSSPPLSLPTVVSDCPQTQQPSSEISMISQYCQQRFQALLWDVLQRGRGGNAQLFPLQPFCATTGAFPIHKIHAEFVRARILSFSPLEQGLINRLQRLVIASKKQRSILSLIKKKKSVILGTFINSPSIGNYCKIKVCQSCIKVNCCMLLFYGIVMSTVLWINAIILVLSLNQPLNLMFVADLHSQWLATKENKDKNLQTKKINLAFH